MKKLVFKQFLPGIIWFYIVLVGLCFPGSGNKDKKSWFDSIYGDKFVHAFLFGLLVYFFVKPILKAELTLKEKRAWLLKIALAGSIWGLTTEFIQKFFIPNRSFELMDWAADTCGIIIAAFYLHNKSNQ